MAKLKKGIPYLTTEEMAHVDELMVKKYKIRLEMMMENAGRNFAHFCIDHIFSNNYQDKRIIIFVGTGANGGSAAVCARHLTNKGMRVEVAIPIPQHLFKGVTAHQLTILKGMRVPIMNELPEDYDEIESYDLIIDGLIGYNLDGPPRDNYAEFIHWANTSDINIAAIDLPSGLDGNSGEAYLPCIRANYTLTVALPKIGMTINDGPNKCGIVNLIDIGVPPELYFEIDKDIAISNILGRNYFRMLSEDLVEN